MQPQRNDRAASRSEGSRRRVSYDCSVHVPQGGPLKRFPARAISALVSVLAALKRQALARRRPGSRVSAALPILRLSRTLTLAVAAGAAGVGGVAFAGIGPSIANAPPERESPTATVAAPTFSPRLQFSERPAIGEITILRRDETEPAPAADALSVPQGRSLTEDEVKRLATAAGWPAGRLNEVAEVAMCESTYNPLATNGVIRGLMQVHPMWFDYAGVPLDQWADPLVNLQVALVVFEYDLQNGNPPWTQWECRPGGQRAPTRPVVETPIPAESTDGINDSTPANSAPVEDNPTATVTSPAPTLTPTEPPATPAETPPPSPTATPEPEIPYEPTATPAPPEPTAAPTEAPPTPPVPPLPPGIPAPGEE